MKLDLFNIEDFIKANHCQEVTSPVFFQYDGNPNPNGLFSYEIFGITDEERKNRFGYIDLHSHFIHPMIYKMMMGRMGSLKDILLGNKYAVVANNKIKIVPETFPGAETGLSFMYDNFEHIKWIDAIEEQEMDSLDKKTRLKFLQSIKKDEFFVDKWLVLPPFYRDQSSTDVSMGDEINKLYKELISKTASLKAGFSFELFGNETKLRIQEILREIYLMTLAPVSGKHLILDKGKAGGTLAGSGKNSMFRKHLLGKTLDWTASCVITSPQNNMGETAEEKPVPFGYSCFPLATLLSMFEPFFVERCSSILGDYLIRFANDNMNKIRRLNTAQFNTDVIERLIRKFIRAPDDRFSDISFEYYDLNGKKVTDTVRIIEYETRHDAETGENPKSRNLTLADLFYIIGTDVLADKHAYVTRYPFAYFQNIFPCRVKILSTSKSRKIYIQLFSEDRVMYFNDYPCIPKYPGDINSKFYDVMILGNAYIKQMRSRLRWRYGLYQTSFYKRSKCRSRKINIRKNKLVDC